MWTTLFSTHLTVRIAIQKCHCVTFHVEKPWYLCVFLHSGLFTNRCQTQQVTLRWFLTCFITTPQINHSKQVKVSVVVICSELLANMNLLLITGEHFKINKTLCFSFKTEYIYKLRSYTEVRNLCTLLYTILNVLQLEMTVHTSISSLLVCLLCNFLKNFGNLCLKSCLFYFKSLPPLTYVANDHPAGGSICQSEEDEGGSNYQILSVSLETCRLSP